MALLTASHTTKHMSSESSMSIHQRSESIRQQSELVQRYAIDEFGPAIRHSNAVRSALLVFARQFFLVNRVAFAYLLFGSTVAVLQTYLVTKALGKIVSSAWSSKRGRRLRKKLEFEFFVLILGCGNSFCLVMFWPGWYLIGLAYLIYLICRWSWAG